MRLEVDLLDETNDLTTDDIELVKEILEKAAEMEGVQQGAELSVTFTDDAKIQEINREYRNRDKPTDVISFALNEQVDGEIDMVGGDQPNLLGDIVISVPRAREQAKSYNHSFVRELGFLAVHGILHLLGYDHQTEEEEKVMFKRQEEILSTYGLER